MYNTIRKALLIAAAAVSCLIYACPAYAEESVVIAAGPDVSSGRPPIGVDIKDSTAAASGDKAHGRTDADGNTADMKAAMGKDAAVRGMSVGRDVTDSRDPAVGKDVTVVGEAQAAKGTGQEAMAAKAPPKARNPEEGYVNAGPGAAKKEEKKAPAAKSLGTFTITGYCGCEKCSNGHGFTFSGTVPTPNHTVSADLELFPLGTRLKIDGTVYTVEDKGSSVKGNIIDIFYNTHEEALSKGTYTAEVFLMEP